VSIPNPKLCGIDDRGVTVTRYTDEIGQRSVHFETLGPLVPVMSNSPAQWTAARGMMPSSAILGLSEFKHYTYRTAGQGERSRPGDLDLVVYGLRRFAGLAEVGNPTILLPLFVPDSAIGYLNDVGRRLRASAPLFASLAAGHRFRGYLQAQRKGLLGERSDGVRNKGRADLRARYGFDTKFAMHMVRLGIQGVEYLTTGRITLPIPEPERTWLRDLRQGRHTMREALDRAQELDEQLERIIASSSLPERPDRRRIDEFLAATYREWWERA
jgi:hypothetical protein